MDPVSITTAVVGLLTAAAKVSTTLTAILQRTSNAPKFAQNVLLEVSDISACLTQLRAFLDGARVESRSRATLILVDQVIVLLTTSMITFSELEKIVESLEPDKSMGLVSKLRWSRKESAISSLLLRLQASKSSLNLMLTALTCTSIEEAQTAVGHFQDLIQQTLTNDEDISRRLANLETQNHNTASNAICAASITTSQNHDVSTENRWSQIDKEEFEASVTRTTVIEYAFESMLQRSRPYTRGLRRNSRCSRTSSVAPSTGWSFFSGVSLADISKTSVISLPIWKSELWNGSHYVSPSITNYRVGISTSLAPAKKIALLDKEIL
ncbi:hypothetical protein MMC22_011643 [Lobaria immixta]|nr:hypothetical protein [Lobaria immixta]